MEPSIDRQISKAESVALQQQNLMLIRQNQLLKQQLAQLKSMQTQAQKELSVYKSIVLKSSSDTEVLQLQHQRIFQLQTQLQVLQGKYSKLLRSGGSQQATEYEIKCRNYQKKLKDNEIEYQKQLSVLRDRLAKQKAMELVESKRLITSPNGQVKKSSMGLGKFV